MSEVVVAIVFAAANGVVMSKSCSLETWQADWCVGVSETYNRCLDLTCHGATYSHCLASRCDQGQDVTCTHDSLTCTYANDS